MAISVTCGGCLETYLVRDENAGRSFKCKSCGESVVVPGSPRKSPDASGSDPAARRRKATRKRTRRPEPEVDDYEHYDDYDESDYDEGSSGSRRARPGRRGRSSKRSAKKPSRPVGKNRLQTALLVVAVSGCVYSAGYLCQIFAKLIVLFSSGLGALSSLTTLLSGYIWLTFLGATGMVAGYVFGLLDSKPRASRPFNIAALATGVLAVGLVFFMEILPRLTGERDGLLGLQSMFAFGVMGGGLWGSVFKQLLLEALLLSHIVLFVLSVRALASGRSSLEESCRLALLPLAAYGGVRVLQSLFLIFLIKIIFGNGMGGFERPSAIWSWISNGLDWLGVAAFTGFLVLYLRVLFISRSELT